MPDLPDLNPLDEAQRRVLDGIAPLPTEMVDVAGAIGVVLAAPVTSALTVPAWTNSAMDGFAVQGADVARRDVGPAGRPSGPRRGAHRPCPRRGGRAWDGAPDL